MTLDRECFRNFDLAYMLILLPETVAQWDEAGRKANPGALECLKTMHGIHVSEADEDLSWLDLGLGHPYRSLVKLYQEYRRKAQMLGKVEDDDTSNFDKYRHAWLPVESIEVVKYRYAWLSMIIKIYQNADKEQCKEINIHANQ
jgi:hypothetical protein